MSDPTQMIPTAGEPDGPNPPMDRRRVAIIVLAVVIGILLVLLIIVSVTGDDSSDTTATDTTSSTGTSTTEATTSSTTSTTAAPEASVSTTTTTTKATSTTTTTAPPTTIALERCTGATGPTEPEPVAIVFYDAWRVDDIGCAAEVADQSAIDTLFALDGTGAQWQFQGCSTFEDPEPKIDCAYTYEGGSTHFTLQYGAIGGWQIVAVEFVAD